METTTINRVQQLQFELMKIASFNNFDGEEVTKDLTEHQDLWEGCLMTRDSRQLITLRDVSDADWNVDTLYVLSSRKDDDKLESLAKDWNANEVDWVEGDEAQRMLCEGGRTGRRILRVWWD